MTRTDRLLPLLAASSDPDNPSAAAVEEIVDRVLLVAVVGMSRDATKPARRVPSYMAAKGHEIIPVNPFAERILGKVAYDRLEDVDDSLDMVQVFRPSEDAGAIVTAAMQRPEQPVIWLQEGIRADAEAGEARSLGLQVVQDLCYYKCHRALNEASVGSRSQVIR